MADRPSSPFVDRRPSPYRPAASDSAVPQLASLNRASSTSTRRKDQIELSPLHQAALGRSATAPFTPAGRRRSDPATPAARDMGDYFLDAPVAVGRDGRRRSSAADAVVKAVVNPATIRDNWNQFFYPPDEELVEPFSFVSTRISPYPSIFMALGLFGQMGYAAGSACLERNLVFIPPPPGVAPGVGGQNPVGDMSHWAAPPLGASIAITAIGLALGLASAVLFLRDGLRIAGNRQKAFAYFSMHLIGIVLITMSRTIVDFRKNKTPHDALLSLILPASLGRGLHWITIPRSFSNCEVRRQADFAPLSFEQRLLLSEAVRILGAIFLGLWAGSWAIVDYNPLERELYAILGSFMLNISAALPNTNLRRADIFRRSQTSLLSPQLQSFQLRSPMPRNVPSQARTPASEHQVSRPALPSARSGDASHAPSSPRPVTKNPTPIQI